MVRPPTPATPYATTHTTTRRGPSNALTRRVHRRQTCVTLVCRFSGSVRAAYRNTAAPRRAGMTRLTAPGRTAFTCQFCAVFTFHTIHQLTRSYAGVVGRIPHLQCATNAPVLRALPTRWLTSTFCRQNALPFQRSVVYLPPPSLFVETLSNTRGAPTAYRCALARINIRRPAWRAWREKNAEDW